MYIYYILFVIGAYLLGSINAAYIYSKLVNNSDIRDYASGNAGATNILRVYGAKAAIPVFFFDALKGYAACKLSMVFFPGVGFITLLAAVAVIAGHNWPIFLDYRGGKGVASSVGVGAALSPLLLIISLAVAVLLIVTTKYVSLGSISGIGLYFILTLIFSGNIYYCIIAGALFVLTVYQHRTNIKRLINGNENKIGHKK